MKRIIGLDIATKTGVAILDGNSLKAYYIEGSPLFQIQKILPLITQDCEIVIEDFSYFNYRNPVTTAQLNQRLGYIFWRLAEEKTVVKKYNVNTVRKQLGISGSRKSGEQKKLLNSNICFETKLKFTPDETDAIALIMYDIGICFSDLHRFNVTRQKRLKE